MVSKMLFSALLVAPISASTQKYVLDGTHRTLPASAPENRALLDLEYAPISDTLATVGEAFEQNSQLLETLNKVVEMPYFSTYKVDLSDQRCPFDDDTATCGNRQCAIEPLSSSDIDDKLFESQYLGRLRKNSVSREAPSDEGAEGCAPASASLYAFNRNYDYCYPEDESQDGVWVDLKGNLERFTGYGGPHARLMWTKVYEENCFGYGEAPAYGDKSTVGDALSSLADVMAHPAKPNLGERAANLEIPDGCVEQRLFYRLLSGMHASISTHLTFDWLNSTSEAWEPNLGEWLERVGWHEDRLDNLFFDYVLISRAVAKLVGEYERQLLFSSSCYTVDTEVRIALRRLNRVLRTSPLRHAIDERRLFATPEGQALKGEFRERVRNVNALMSCVGCERCRLWGKIQTAGYGTALKILFELPATVEEDAEAAAEVLQGFRRSELVALLNTFARISHSVYATQFFLQEAEEQLVDTYSYSYQWRLAWRDTVKGFKFIFWSYVRFPKTVFKLAIYYGHVYWTRFVTGGNNFFTEIEDLNEGFHVEL